MNFLSHLALISFITYLFLGIYALCLDRKAKLNRIFMLVCMCFGWWAFTYSLIYSAADKQMCFFWHKASVFSWCISLPLVVHTILVLIRKENQLPSPWGYLGLYLPGIVFSVKGYTGMLFTRDFKLTMLGWVDLPATGTHWYAAYLIYISIYIITGAILLTHHYAYGIKSKRERKQFDVIKHMAILTTVTSVSVNIVLPLLGICYIPHIAPILLIMVAFSVWYAIVRYKLMVLTPAIAASEIIDSVQDMLLLASRKFEILKINQRVSEILGYNQRELLGRPLSSILSQKICEDICVNSDENTGGVLASDIIPFKAKNGETIPIRIYVSAIRDKVIGDITGYVVICQDMRLTEQLKMEIIQRKFAEEELQNQADYLFKINEKLRFEIDERVRIEKALRESEEKFRELFNNNNDPVFVCCVQENHLPGKYIEVNNVACSVLGYTKEELLKLTPFDITVKDHLSENTINRNKQFVMENGYLHMETNLVTKGKVEIPFEIRGRFFKLNSVEVILYVARELTERRQLIQEMVNVEKLQSLGILAGGIAHDFNNILTAVLGNISVARHALNINDIEKARKLLEKVEKASLQAKDLTYQLLTFSKGGEPIKTVTSIVDLIKQSAYFMLRGSNVSCEVSIHECIWPVEIDSGQISQVINNMIINASQAMPSGGVIEISCSNFEDKAQLPIEEKFVVISIQDYGSGIRKENLKSIFDPYFTTKKAGSGLGLAISYSIIKKHGGYIDVQSEVGYGTTFSIFLPACLEKEHTNAETQKRFIKGQGRILVMDDDNEIRELLKIMLAELGYQVELARDGKEAINLYLKHREMSKSIDAIIMDLTIPGGMGGLESASLLREIEPDVKIIVSSGYSNDPVMANFKSCGFDGVITKPYDIEEMGILLHKLVYEQNERCAENLAR